MKLLEQKIKKLEKEKARKVERRNQLDEEISLLNIQLKELNDLENRYIKLNKATEKALRGLEKNNPKIEENNQKNDENFFV